MGKAIKLSEDMIGKKVRCINRVDLHHPKVGTIGTIVMYDKEDTNSSYKIQWPKGSTKCGDRWWAINKCIELVEDDETSKQEIPDMTNEEIWEMLQPKMNKNGLVISGVRDYIFGSTLVYDYQDVHNAIALAYKVGYLRSQKGRPFKIGEKKKKQGGHWKPVDPNNLPKEGTKVRYARHIDDMGAQSFSEWTGIQIGEVTTVKRVGNEFWVEDIHNENEGNPLCSFLHPERFDMWVEDDE